jgi:tRNA-dihydrouridine synthase B
MSSLSDLDTNFKIRDVQIPGRVMLAPMDGYTDSPFRSLCREFGSSLSTSEFINGIDVKYGHPHLKYTMAFSPGERPFSYQVFDSDPQRLLEAATKLTKFHPDLIDINMGCSARNVSNRGAGAGLLRHPEKIRQIALDLVKHLHVPVTAKIRLGWDENSRNYHDIARILEDCGISAITVHARTRKQQYQGKADWDAIAEVKSIITIPVIGNGDVNSRNDALRMMQHTGCDAVMIGRAALGNPWVFSNINIKDLSIDQYQSVIFTHLARMIDLYSPRTGVILFRKHLSRYMQDYLPTASIRKKIFSIEDYQELHSEITVLLHAQE